MQLLLHKTLLESICVNAFKVCPENAYSKVLTAD